MTATSRYWDYESCAWIAYEAAAATSFTGATPESLPEQRADEAAPAPAAGQPVATS